jgi:hypothetical protein
MRTLKGQTVVRNESNPSDYPFDRILDAVPGVSAGTPGEEKTFGDLLQGFYEVLRRAGITPDETPEKKDSSQFADAIELLAPVAVIKVGFDSTIKVLGGTYKRGYSAEYAASLQLTGAVATKLTIKKDGVVSTENFYVDVTITSSAALKDQITAGASHGSNNAFGYFDNDDNNIYISANGGGTSDADLEKVNLIIKVFKA